MSIRRVGHGAVHVVSRLLLIGLVFSVPLLTQDSYYLQVASAMGIAAILALGLNFLYGFTGQISFATAGFMAIGAYTAAILTTNLGLSFFVSLVPAIMLSGAVAWAVGLPTLRLRGHYLSIATMALQLAIQAFIIAASAITAGNLGIFRMERPSIATLSFRSDGSYYLLIALGAVLTYVFADRLINSRYGRALISVREDELGAAAIGVAVPSYKVSAFVISAMMVGLAGALFAYQLLYIGPANFDITWSVAILSMVVIGGVGSNAGAVLGAVFVTIVRQLLFGFGDVEFLVYGLAIVLVLLFLPGGLVGIVDAIVSRVHVGGGADASAEGTVAEARRDG